MEVFEFLHTVFKQYSAQEGRTLAATMTSSINQALRDHDRQIELHDAMLQADQCARLRLTVSVQPSLLALPWQAYNNALIRDTGYRPDLHEIEGLLCTIPDGYKTNDHFISDHHVFYKGSLIEYLSYLIRTANKELIIINPYWSAWGVDSLLGRLPSSFTAPEKCIFIVRDTMDTDDEEALKLLSKNLQKHGSTIAIYEPCLSGSQNIMPLVHAKAMVADSTHAYLGSANLSKNGLQNSIEIGIGLKGTAAKGIREWLISLLINFQKRN